MTKNDLEIFVGKEVGVMYVDSDKECYERGVIKNLNRDGLILERCKSKSPVYLSLDIIKKIKVVDDA